MKKILFVMATAFLFVAAKSQHYSKMKKPVEVGGAPMYATKNIIENAVNSKDHTTLVAALKAAGLTDALQGAGPFTVFAPTNAAFVKLPNGTVDMLLKPENKDGLTAVLTYHVVAGNWDLKSIKAKIKEGGGNAKLTTLQGGAVWASWKDNKVILRDEKGGMASVIINDVYQSNGIIHVIDAILLPKN